MTHEQAIDAICGVLGVTVLSYQEAIEGYLTLRGLTDFEALAAQGIEAGTAETGTGSVHESPVAESDAP